VISYAVVGHVDRLLAATDLAHSLSAVVALDDGSKGAAGNHLAAWELTTTLPAAWAAVLEDDAQPVPGFLTQAAQALTAAPEPVVSLYLGRTRLPDLGALHNALNAPEGVVYPFTRYRYLPPGAETATDLMALKPEREFRGSVGGLIVTQRATWNLLGGQDRQRPARGDAGADPATSVGTLISRHNPVK